MQACEHLHADRQVSGVTAPTGHLGPLEKRKEASVITDGASPRIAIWVQQPEIQRTLRALCPVLGLPEI